jgi:hypothetical protein
MVWAAVSHAADLADRILDVATQRLVLLVAEEDDTVSFDVRSLQELMAARGLVDSDDATIRRNLTAAACNPNWRNTWLFAAGRLFADSDHRRNLVVSSVERCDVEGHGRAGCTRRPRRWTQTCSMMGWPPPGPMSSGA